MNIIRWLIFVAVFLLPWNQALAEPPLRIATEGAYPPFNNIDKDGRLVGFDIDITEALCKAMGREYTLRAVPWKDILTGLINDEYDVIIASMARTPEREKLVRFTQYYFRSRTMFVGSPSKTFIQTPEGLAGMRLAAQQGTVQEAYLHENFGHTATIVPTKTNEHSFALLKSGDVDAVLSVSLSIYGFLQTETGKHFDFVGSPLPASDPSSEACIAVRKGNKKLADQLNKAIRDIRLSGVYDKINYKYFPFSIY